MCISTKRRCHVITVHGGRKLGEELVGHLPGEQSSHLATSSCCRFFCIAMNPINV